MSGEPGLPESETYLAATSGISLGERFTPGTLVAGRFRIVAPLGRGGMGEVFRADDTRLGHAVALKFLPRHGAVDPGLIDRLRAEVRLGRQVSHPNVCRLYDIGESPEGPFIAMEYVDGEDLASLLRRIGRLPPDKALEIARDLSAGLAAAHDLGILHRDLKPAKPGVLLFVYRSSTRPMIAWSSERRITMNDPPFVDPGMTRVVLDPMGRLISFEAIPPQKESAPAAAPDWSPLFREASIDPSRFHAVAPIWSAAMDVDDKKAWDGTLAEQPDVPLHIEAGAYHGRLDWFRVFSPWDAPIPLREPAQPLLERLTTHVGTSLDGLLLVPAVILAIRNFRRGRGDRRGAFRLAAVMIATTTIALVFRADHVAAPEEWLLIDSIVGRSVWAGTFAWMVYMALEPYVRRKLPHTLIGWSRLVDGRMRDPMVGRDVLIGVLSGAAVLSILHLQRLLPPLFGASAPSPLQPWTSPLASVRHVAYFLSKTFISSRSAR